MRADMESADTNAAPDTSSRAVSPQTFGSGDPSPDRPFPHKATDISSIIGVIKWAGECPQRGCSCHRGRGVFPGEVVRA